MAGSTGSHGNGDEKFREKVYKQLWTIPDWDMVQRNRVILSSQTFEFETDKATPFQTKWLLGLRIESENRTSVKLFWKLIDAGKGFPEGKVQAIISCALLLDHSYVYWKDIQESRMTLGQVVEVPRDLPLGEHWAQLMTFDGELIFELELTIMEPELLSVDLKLELFHQNSVKQLGVNLGSLIGDEDTADVKVMTSDGTELLAHKAILKAQCPVFESMFRSDLSENKTGVVTVKDVNSKTMSIILHFLYTGNLLSSWKDLDTIVEFTYAVGKYQLALLLKLLDEVLGSRDEEDATYTDVQLLDLVQNLGLKTAEKELLERIKKTTGKVTSGMELFALYGINKKEKREIKTIGSKY